MSVKDTPNLFSITTEVFRALLADDFAVLRRFHSTSSLAAYLTVISRRVVVRELLTRVTSALALAESGILERQSRIHQERQRPCSLRPRAVR
jgi:hypothetical protein